MLVPEVFQVLGGLVEELDAARQRLFNEVNKPPRGKRLVDDEHFSCGNTFFFIFSFVLGVKT